MRFIFFAARLPHIYHLPDIRVHSNTTSVTTLVTNPTRRWSRTQHDVGHEPCIVGELTAFVRSYSHHLVLSPHLPKPRRAKVLLSTHQSTTCKPALRLCCGRTKPITPHVDEPSPSLPMVIMTQRGAGTRRHTPTCIPKTNYGGVSCKYCTRAHNKTFHK